MQTKICTKCGRELPLAEFYKGRGKYGRVAPCKRCYAAYNAAYRATPKGKTTQAKYEASPEGKAARAKYRASPEGKAAQAKYEASPKRKAARAKYKASPKGKATIKRKKFKRRSRFNIDPILTADEWEKILDLYDNRCAYCGAKADLQQDHIIPVSKGGKHEAANVVPSCRRCNSFKRVKLPADLPARYRAAIRRHAELLGAADIPIIEQERLYAQF